MTGAASAPPLIAHVVHRFDYGGLENGIVNLINRMPEDAFRHCVIALTEATDFASRLQKPGVSVHTLNKKPGKDPAAYVRLYRLLRELRPAVLHTRNIGTLDCAPIGRLAGIPVCLHGEHGWDTHDPDGTNPKYRRLRRLLRPFVRRFITVSEELRRWLVDVVGIDASRVVRICNGVDTDRFYPERGRHHAVAERFDTRTVIVGSVLRFNEIKDPMNLVDAFIAARPRAAARGVDLGLVMVGDGPLRERALARLHQAGQSDSAWLPGSRDDVPAILRSLDIFALGSRREGISNTLLEAMASGLPLVATDTGGNVELIDPERNGVLVPPGESEALARALLELAADRDRRLALAEASRQRAIAEFSLDRMVDEYRGVYEQALTKSRG